MRLLRTQWLHGRYSVKLVMLSTCARCKRPGLLLVGPSNLPVTRLHAKSTHSKVRSSHETSAAHFPRSIQSRKGQRSCLADFRFHSRFAEQGRSLLRFAVDTNGGFWPYSADIGRVASCSLEWFTHCHARLTPNVVAVQRYAWSGAK